MKTLTNNPNCLVDDGTKILTSSQPAKKDSLFVDTGIQSLPLKLKKGMTIFLVDDDLLYLTAMKHYLMMEMPSLQIKTFQTGEAALVEMDQKPDIIILDYYLNSKVSAAENGIVILQQIKQVYPDAKVVMLSGQDEIKVAMTSVEHGAYEYVSKGVTAFIKIKNIVTNIAANKIVLGKIKRQMRFFKLANLIMVLMLVLFYVLSH